ncbi:MAG: TetR/AcrR family transcriptional regulator [Ruthenibacterium sp.]
MHGCAQKVVENTVEKKATKRALQAQRTKENIYRCGVKLFREYGFEAVTVEQLAKAAGVGIGTFYHYYPSKMALYTKLFIHAEDYFEEFETGQALQGSAYDVLQQYFKKYAALNAEPGQEFAQVLVTREGRAFLGGNRDFEKKLEALLAHYQQEGQLNTSRTAAEWCEYLFICARGVLFDWSIHPSTDYDVEKKMHFVIGNALQAMLQK